MKYRDEQLSYRNYLTRSKLLNLRERQPAEEFLSGRPASEENLKPVPTGTSEPISFHMPRCPNIPS